MQFSTLFIGFNLFFPGPDTAEYRKYEVENMGQFREKIQFIQPLVKLPEAATAPTIHVSENSDPSDTIRVTWTLPERLIRMYDMHHPVGEAALIEGYRVQIYAGPNYDMAKKIKSEFVQEFSDETVYDTWESPHFRIRTGDFLTRNEALTFANRIKEKFAGAFVVPDKIKIRRTKKIAPLENPEDELREIPEE